MKKFLVLAVLVVFAVGCVALGGGSVALGETFEGVGQGYRGPIRVVVYINGRNITEIVVDSVEDRFVGGAAMEELIDAVIEYNSTDVDAVTGATESSRGFLEAIENAILKQWETVYFVE